MTKNTKKEFAFECRRKLLHLSSLWIPFSGLMLSFDMALLLIFVVTLVVIIADALRLIPGKISKLSWTLIKTLRLQSLYRTSEISQLSGASYMMISALISIIIFPQNIFFIAFIILIICDTAAALIGIKYGNHKLMEKRSWEGSAAFFISALIISTYLAAFFKYPISSALIATLVTNFVELIAPKLKINDNLLIPLAFGLTFTESLQILI